MCSLRPAPFSYLCMRVRIWGRLPRGATLLSGEEVLPSEEGHRAARLRGVPRRHAERPWPSLVFQAVGPWKRTELLSAVCGPVQSVRPIQNGKFLIGCHSEGQQGKLSRCQSLPGGVGIQCRIPVPTVEAVIRPIPLGEWALKQIM